MSPILQSFQMYYYSSLRLACYNKENYFLEITETKLLWKNFHHLSWWHKGTATSERFTRNKFDCESTAAGTMP